jgi:hypothetical protein
MHTVKESDMLATKIDLIKRLDVCAAKKQAMKTIVLVTELQMTCNVCGEVRHSGNNCPETREDAAYKQ